MGNLSQVVIVDGLRTAIGNFNGGFAKVPAHQLGSKVISALLEKHNISGSDIDEVIMGQVLTASCGQNVARQSALGANIAIETPAWTVNQVCGSGLKTVGLAYNSIATGQANIVIAGGQENMSLSPHVINLRSGVKMGDANMQDSMIIDGLWDIFNDYHMGVTAENIAKKFNISRQEQDEFACKSQNKAQKAQEDGLFNDEIVPVEVKNRKETIIIKEDEFPRHNTSVESLAKLRPAFDKEGTVTAGNASGINDGAAGLILMSEDEANKRGLKPLARIKSFGQAGVDPSIMGTGPIYAVQKALKNANWTIDDLDLIESNEAFAAQAISVNKELGWDESKININGGAIALGHPIGASGARILVTLLHSMQRENANKALATLCIGGGMGVALCVEKI